MSAPALPSVSAPSDSVSQWKRYPAYKESGADWLGEVPEHWEVGPLKRFASFVSRGNSPEYVDDSSIQVINQACIYWNGLRLANVKFQRETDISAWKGRLAVGDLLINSTGTGTLGRASIFDRQGTFIADGHVTVVRLNTGELSTQYLLYLVQTPIYQGYIYAAIISGSTNQIELSRDGLRATPIMVPPIMEQQVIAAFLGRETARIDQLIAKKERQIELLQEKRAAIISHTVTKGLDASVPMKGSGADWLGKIPSHWEVKRLKYTVTECSNGTWGAEPVGDDSDLVCVRVADFDRARGRINPTNLTMRSISTFAVFGGD